MLILQDAKDIEILHETSVKQIYVITDKNDEKHIVTPKEFRTLLSETMLYGIIATAKNEQEGLIEF